MKCLIVEDDQMARASIELMCQKIDDLEVVGSFDNGLDALKMIKSVDVDVLLLDIQMPDFSGLDLIKSLEKKPQIILTTGHAEYAVEAFEHRVTDFLTKPVELPRLLKALDHARQNLASANGSEEMSELFIKVDGRYVRLDLEDVLYVESLGDYVTFRTSKEKYIVHSTLKNIDDKIKNSKFLKVHRSYIVNLSKVVDIEETNMVIADKVIPVSRAHKPILMNKIKTI
ncbi:MAG: DNA-binding response regulator [Flammeovirgaceae bacterium]|nr:DNA-binding response regulator [Flammeovirgaceae bacterium]MBR06585.1 DNA-binding response regulator [Rickettsiales bacterium]HCX23571.1 DNA-binding response regulator [Cytophagales bacterium]|tara:strand:- start:2445 stop:3128 length:684 start_codon:yes stop_codon:yes gene_type:complete